MGDKQTLTKLFELFYHGTSNKDVGGIFYDAALLLSRQSYLVPVAKEYTSVNWKVNAITFSIPIAVFFLIVPLCGPNGESVGKWIMRMGIAKKNGTRIGVIQRLFRPLVVLAIVSIFIIVPRAYTIFTLLGIMLLLFIDFFFVLRDKTGAYRSLQDRMVGTVVVSKKNSTIFKTEDEVNQFISDSEVVVTQNQQVVKATDTKAYLMDGSIVDGEILSRSEEISSYDDFESKDE